MHFFFCFCIFLPSTSFPASPLLLLVYCDILDLYDVRILFLQGRLARGHTIMKSVKNRIFIVLYVVIIRRHLVFSARIYQLS